MSLTIRWSREALRLLQAMESPHFSARETAGRSPTAPVGIPRPSVFPLGWRVHTVCGPRSLSQVLVRFAFRHAMLSDSTEVSGALAVNAPLLVAFPNFRPGRPSDYTLTKLNRFTPQGYGLDVALFTLSPRPRGLRPNTRFSVEG